MKGAALMTAACVQDTQYAVISLAVPGSVQELLMLQEGGIAVVVGNVLTAISQLSEVCIIVLAACISMTLVAQAKAERCPHLPWKKLFVIGAMFGVLLSFLSSWSWIAIVFFAVVVGVANTLFPYTFYMTEIQKDPADVSIDTPDQGPASLSYSMKKHVLVGLCFALSLLLLKRLTHNVDDKTIVSTIDETEGCDMWTAWLSKFFQSIGEQDGLGAMQVRRPELSRILRLPAWSVFESSLWFQRHPVGGVIC